MPGFILDLDFYFIFNIFNVKQLSDFWADIQMSETKNGERAMPFMLIFELST